VLAAGLSASPLASAVAADSGRLAAAQHVESPADVSSNWAGYVATGPGSNSTTASPSMSYTDVTGQWVEPTATCSGAPTSVALWVGLGGYSESSNELEQTGTAADCSADGTASYYAWYELVPANSINVTMKILPGDVITSSVVANGRQILVQVIDRTRGTRFTKRLKMATPDLSSAEWIAEAPSECGSNNYCRQLALTNFGDVNFIRTYAIGNSLPGTITSANWTATAIQLIPRSHRFFGDFSNGDGGGMPAGAAPLALAADGSGFGIEWQANAGT
jgi:hypothetical protein